MLRVPRIVLYSHDTMGLGHMRRNLLLAHALVGGRTGPALLLLSGASEIRTWALPPGAECLTLPAVHKDPHGHYQSRRMPVPLESVIAIRRRTLTAALEAFEPDLVVVDKVPGGLEGELEPALKSLRRRGTRFVLGLRDVLDDPSQVRTEWIRDGSYHLAAECYDAIWVYGDPRLANPIDEYGFGPEIAEKLHFTGFLDPLSRLDPTTPSSLADLSGPIALCLVGGGQDGAALARAFADAPLPADMTGVIVTGPHLPFADYQHLTHQAALRANLRVLRFEANLDALIARADRVVAMGGYNTVMEILAHQRPALIVPRVTPRTEQLIRAERLAAMGLVDVLHPAEAVGSTLGTWLAAPPRALPSARTALDFGGLSRVQFLASTMLAARRPRRGTQTSARSFAYAAG